MGLLSIYTMNHENRTSVEHDTESRCWKYTLNATDVRALGSCYLYKLNIRRTPAAFQQSLIE